MKKKIYITGIGIITAIGNNVSENLNSLINKKTGIGHITHFDTVHKADIPVGEVKLSNVELLRLLGLSPSDNAYTRTALLGMTAAFQAVNNSGITEIGKYKTGIVSSTTVAGMRETENYYRNFQASNYSNDYIKTHEAGDSTEKIADFLGIKNIVSTISTACSSSSNAIMFGARLIEHGFAERIIAGGSDSLSKFTINGFNTLKILDSDICKPFDDNRCGLNLGEGAAFIVLESADIVKKEGKSPLAELLSYSNINDAFHQTASSPDGKGAFTSMQEALRRASLTPKDIDYINVHGTGTSNNDLSEGRAIEKLFKYNIPKFSSTKSFTGHTLAAAGAVESVFSILSIKNKMIFPNINFKKKMKELDLIPETKLIKNINVNKIMSNSFGFGGNCTSLVIGDC